MRKVLIVVILILLVSRVYSKDEEKNMSSEVTLIFEEPVGGNVLNTSELNKLDMDNMYEGYGVYYAVAEEKNNYFICDEPLFTDEDISTYNWNTQSIVLEEGIIKELPLPPNYTSDKFMVFVNKELVSEGYFQQSLYSSFYPTGVVMNRTPDGVKFVFHDVEGMDLDDTRFHDKIYDRLENVGMLED